MATKKEKKEVLRIEELTKKYGSFVALNNVSFSLTEGEVVGFLGQNGAGKSTTIKILSNLISPTSGGVWLDGVDILNRRDGEHRRKIGVIVEAPRFYPTLSGKKNLEFLAEAQGVSKERVITLLKEVGLTERAHEKFGRYSMGMKQRLGLAAVLLHEPSLIILDEPTTGLDPVGRKQILELIKTLKKKHDVTILFCSHILSEVEELCDRALVLHEGSLILDQSLKSKGGFKKVESCFGEIAQDMTEKGEVG